MKVTINELLNIFISTTSLVIKSVEYLVNSSETFPVLLNLLMLLLFEQNFFLTVTSICQITFISRYVNLYLSSFSILILPNETFLSVMFLSYTSCQSLSTVCVTFSLYFAVSRIFLIFHHFKITFHICILSVNITSLNRVSISLSFTVPR